MGLEGCIKSLSLTVKVIVRGDRNCHRMSQENIVYHRYSGCYATTIHRKENTG